MVCGSRSLWRGSFISPWIKRQSKPPALYFITQVPRPPRITASARHQGDQLQGPRRVSVWVARSWFIWIFPHPSLQPCYLGIPVHCNHGRCRCLHEDFSRTIRVFKRQIPDSSVFLLTQRAENRVLIELPSNSIMNGTVFFSPLHTLQMVTRELFSIKACYHGKDFS